MCSVQCAVCSARFAVCSVQCAVHGLQCAVPLIVSVSVSRCVSSVRMGSHSLATLALMCIMQVLLYYVTHYTTQACPLQIFGGRNIADKPKNLGDQLPQKLSSPHPIFQLPQKFVQLPYLQQKFFHCGYKSPAAEEICTP